MSSGRRVLRSSRLWTTVQWFVLHKNLQSIHPAPPPDYSNGPPLISPDRAINAQFIYLIICLFICLFVYLFICLFVYLFIYLFIYLFCRRCSRPNFQQCFLELFLIGLVAAVVPCGSILSSGAQSVLICSKWFYSQEHQLHHPPLPPIFYSHCYPFTQTANIVFLVYISAMFSAQGQGQTAMRAPLGLRHWSCQLTS